LDKSLSRVEICYEEQDGPDEETKFTMPTKENLAEMLKRYDS
jgi:hypothetical protein